MATTTSTPDIEDLRRRAHAKPRTPSERLEDHARQQRDVYTQQAAALLDRAEREGRQLSDYEQAKVDAALNARQLWALRYDESKADAAAARDRYSIRREPLTYRAPGEGGTHSYFRDAWNARVGNHEAEQRLERHAKEAAVEMRRLQARADREQADNGATFERRVNPSRTSGFGGSFAPPLWLIEQFATYPRPERVLADLCTTSVLPQGVQSINLPRLTTGVEELTVSDDTPPAEKAFADTGVTAQVQTISGSVDVALQLLEQSPIGQAHLDEVVWRDLTSAYDARLEAEVTNGAGTGHELLGVLNVAEKGEITYTSASPKATEAYTRLGEVAGNISDNRKLRLECWVMRGGRWFGSLLATGEDEQKRPIVVPFDIQSPTAPAGPIGTLLGNVPVYLSESIPTTLGTGKNQDVIIGIRPRDSYLWESEPYLSLFDSVLSATMEARIQLRCYVAFAPHRYPSSICTLGGTGLKVEVNE